MKRSSRVLAREKKRCVEVGLFSACHLEERREEETGQDVWPGG
jgi:hypothetical protein